MKRSSKVFALLSSMTLAFSCCAYASSDVQNDIADASTKDVNVIDSQTDHQLDASAVIDAKYNSCVTNVYKPITSL